MSTDNCHSVYSKWFTDTQLPERNILFRGLFQLQEQSSFPFHIFTGHV